MSTSLLKIANPQAVKGDPAGGALVKALGVSVVAAGLGVTVPCVSNWVRRGVPRAHRFLVAQIAERRGFAVPDGFLPTLAGDNACA
ncbi:hypothetical protein [Azospirillum picis]|uniref:Transcriptional regulator n=1 Tax=Azospirillum picis TaxID=488438 RepID=A0ABU0MUI6_9PROT|nr:hypothetical protein [Azospirillum picis]MBP2303302.1 hypothetical protein [Azospirillum picis]MDQ0537158.1 hypothetical protein [Azospirillum picis]